VHHLNAVGPFLKDNVQALIFTSMDSRTANKLIEELDFRDAATIRYYQYLRKRVMSVALFCDGIEGFCSIAYVPLCQSIPDESFFFK